MSERGIETRRRTVAPPVDAPRLPEFGQEFRRKQFVAPRKRRRLLVRLLKPFGAALAIVGLPALTAGWVFFSDAFSVKSVRAESSNRVPSTWVQERLADLEGEHLIQVSLQDVEVRLLGHPWVRGVRLNKQLPDGLVVQIVEREPAALLVDGDELQLIDEHGYVIAPYDPMGETGDYFVLKAEGSEPRLLAGAIELVRRWQRRGLPWASALSEVEVLSARDYRVFVAGLPCPLLVSPEQLETGLAALARYRSQIQRRLPALASVDLRFEGQIVFQLAAASPHNGEGASDV